MAARGGNGWRANRELWITCEQVVSKLGGGRTVFVRVNLVGFGVKTMQTTTDKNKQRKVTKG